MGSRGRERGEGGEDPDPDPRVVTLWVCTRECVSVWVPGGGSVQGHAAVFLPAEQSTQDLGMQEPENK